MGLVVVPKEASVIDNMAARVAGSTAKKFGGSDVEAGGAIGDGEVTSTLEKSRHCVSSTGSYL